MTTHRPPRYAIPALGTGLGAPALAISGPAAWLIILTYVLGLAAWHTATLVQTTFPQNSADRLPWWQDRRHRADS
jgi:hypothetical protein